MKTQSDLKSRFMRANLTIFDIGLFIYRDVRCAVFYRQTLAPNPSGFYRDIDETSHSKI